MAATIVSRDGQMLSVQEAGRIVAEHVLTGSATRLLRAIPYNGAGGSSWRMDFDDAGVERSVFVKFPAETGPRYQLFAQRLRREFEITRQVQSAFRETAHLETVKVAAFVEPLQALVTWAIPGKSLESSLRKESRPFSRHLEPAVQACSHAGEWLRELHRLPVSQDHEDARKQIATFLDDRLVTLQRLPGSEVSESLARTLRAALFERLTAALDSEAPVLCHNDFSPHNMLLDGERLCVLDFSFAGPGLSAFDAACFWHKLEDFRASPLHASERVTRMQHALQNALGLDFSTDSPAVTLGIARLVLSKMITVLKHPSRRPDLRVIERRLYARWIGWLRQRLGTRRCDD